MRNFNFLIFLFIFISLSSALKATTLLNFSSEESSKITIAKKSNSSTNSTLTSEEDINLKSAAPTTQKTDKKINKEERTEFRKAIWKSIKEQRKVNKKVRKENRKNGIKNPNQKIHWAAYVAIFAAFIALGIIIAVLFLGATYTIFNILGPIALLLLPISIISGIIGVSVVLNDNNEKFDKAYTLILSLVGGIFSLLLLLFIISLILALATAF
jgi:hypothetical protein